MTPPLVSTEVDLRDFQFMPLDVLRLRDSDLASCSTGDEFKAAVLLWCAAWHQVPAGSVPNDERWLARHSGAGSQWKKVRAAALSGFVACSDGRLYHRVVSEKAVESWAKKQEQRAKTLRARIAACEKRLKEAVTDADRQHAQQQLQALSQHLSQGVSQPPRDSEGTVKGKVPLPDGNGARGARSDPVKEEIWKSGRALLEAQGVGKDAAGSFLGGLVKDYGQTLVLEAVRDCARVTPASAKEWLVARCQERRGTGKQTQLERRNAAVASEWAAGGTDAAH